MCTTDALECPTGRGGRERKEIIFLPSDMNCVEVVNDYTVKFRELRATTEEDLGCEVGEKHLTFS